MWKCPECHNQIDELKYNVSTVSSEYGTATLSDEKTDDRHERIVDHNCDDSGDTDWDGRPEYECPECDSQILISELEWIDKEEIKIEELPQEPEETKYNIIMPLRNIINTEESKDTSDSSIICKICFHVFVCEESCDYYHKKNEELFECPNCNHSNTFKEYRELLKSNFFKT